MKKLITTLVISLFTAVTINAQESNKANDNILICNTNKAEFTKQELIDCNTVSVKGQELPVVSMVVSLTAGGGLIELMIQGNKFNERVIQQLNKDIEYKNLYLEKITLADGSEVGFKTIKLKQE